MRKNCVICGGEFEARGRMKTCSTKCSRENELEYFRKWYRKRCTNTVEKRREYDRKYYATNRRTLLNKKSKQYAAQPEKYRERNHKRYAADPEKYREQRRKRYAAQPEKYREQNRKRNRKYAKALAILKQLGIEL